MATSALRTPDERFANLPGYAFSPHYIDDFPLAAAPGMRLHYLDEGPRDAEHTFLCLHGQPTWSYLYRKMIPVFTSAGHRAVAPDFFGFGRSDKPVDDSVYTFDFHRQTLISFIEHLDLRNITLVCQDWGGLLGLTLPMDMSDRFARLLVMNTAVATGLDPGPGFRQWLQWSADNPEYSLAGLMKREVPGITDDEAAAYAAPFPDGSYRAGVRRFPALVPIDKTMDGAATGMRAAGWLSSQWNGPTFMAVGKKDRVLGLPIMKIMQQMIRGCPPPLILEEAGHFVQEAGEQVASAALAAFATAESAEA